jgi:hypothetical protein
MNRLKYLMSIARERDAAMHRARWCRTNNISGVEFDVRMARRFNRHLVRMKGVM